MSNILDQSKNTAHISFGESQSKLEKISWFIDRRSWFIDRSWFTKESNGQKLDWLGLSSSFSMYLKTELNINLSKMFPNSS